MVGFPVYKGFGFFKKVRRNQARKEIWFIPTNCEPLFFLFATVALVILSAKRDQGWANPKYDDLQANIDGFLGCYVEFSCK